MTSIAKRRRAFLERTMLHVKHWRQFVGYVRARGWTLGELTGAQYQQAWGSVLAKYGSHSE